MPTIDCLDVLKAGLPDNNLPARHIVVVGAGMAGLMAGLLLREAGHRVTILEAQNRLGGRVYTYHGFPGKLYGEFGAMRFPRQHQLAQHLIQERFQLSTAPFGMLDEDTFIYLNNTALRRSQFTPAACGFQLSDAEALLAPADLLRRTVQPLLELMDQKDGWQRVVERYDRYSLIDYFRESELSDQALEMIGPLLNLEGRFHFSLVEWFSHYYEGVFGDLLYIVDGADSLPYAFAPHLMDVIRLGAYVHAIDQDDEGVTIHYHDNSGFAHSVAADECIVTIPFVLLRHLEIQGLDANKWYTIRNIYYGRAHKIFMQFSERWWQTKYDITHGVTVTDLAIRNVVYTPAGQDYEYPRGVLIASYAWDQDSMAYSMLTEQQRIAQALQDLAKIHPEARETFEFGVSHDWALDPYAGGIGPIFRPHELSGRFFEDIVRPVNRVWFANDACDRRHRRWIEGALLAAVKNAFAIHTGMRNEIPGEL